MNGPELTHGSAVPAAGDRRHGPSPAPRSREERRDVAAPADRRRRRGRPDAALIRLGAELEASWRQEDAAWMATKDSMAAYHRAEALLEANNRLVSRISARRAFSITGLQVKVRALAWCSYDPQDREGNPLTAEAMSGFEQPWVGYEVIASLLRDLPVLWRAAA